MKARRDVIDFTNPDDLEAVALAKFGMADSVISEHTGLNQGRINYRLRKAKNLEGLPDGVGYRTAWRKGTSPEARSILRTMLPNVKQSVKRSLPRRIVHPAPEVVEQQRAA